MKENYTHISMVLDRSGSMSSIREDTIGGFNVFLNEQKKVEGKATMTFAQFDNHFDFIYQMKDIQDCEELNSETYVPRGMTALLDAIGRTITDTGIELEKLSEKERPEQVILVIITDGHENCSQEYTKDKINEMIKHQEDKYDWEVVYLGANQDAIKEGGAMGFSLDKSMTFDCSSDGIQGAYLSVATNTTKYRNKVSKGMDFSTDDRIVQEDLLKQGAA